MTYLNCLKQFVIVKIYQLCTITQDLPHNYIPVGLKAKHEIAYVGFDVNIDVRYLKTSVIVEFVVICNFWSTSVKLRRHYIDYTRKEPGSSII